VSAVQYGPIRAHAVSLDEATVLIAERAKSGKGGFVLTPNFDHIAIARHEPAMAAAYERAFLSVVDGIPLVVISRLLGLAVRQKVSGSDLFEPLMARCATEGVPVYFLGATAETCEQASRKLRTSYPAIEIAGFDASDFDLERAPEAAEAALSRARDSGARLIVVCLPPRKQLMLARFEDAYRPAVGIGAGSTLAFYVGVVQRAPSWISRAGLEWLFRLSREPRRLWRRYLVEDMAAVPVFARMALDRLRGRPLQGPDPELRRPEPAA
jgi:N-acetylglucosaminyldiphosphoundecaprenol N-acetyl-beta-D-mannosaminyltransferase